MQIQSNLELSLESIIHAITHIMFQIPPNTNLYLPNWVRIDNLISEIDSNHFHCV